MLDVPFADEDRTFDGLGLPEGEVPLYSYAWHPRLVLLPTWQLDAKARLVKRLVDLGLALSGLIVLASPALLLVLAIRLDSAGPALYRQQRIGRFGRIFTALKFRSMVHDPDVNGTIRQATNHDPRVTRIGRWMRRYSVDELPQLINVLRGEMSIVGPRPHAPGTRAGGQLFEDVAQCYATRHFVKPGLTGLAQVRGWRGETDTEEKLLHRIDCDLEYIAHWSVGLDLAIIWRTACSVLRMGNAY
ncbi:MAG: sugar transferase [Acetobacteraceae bacterium]|jgi:lipopolysaccharide/colanic/teichoic acid biosynthesis glycosyltransferase